MLSLHVLGLMVIQLATTLLGIADKPILWDLTPRKYILSAHGVPLPHGET